MDVRNVDVKLKETPPEAKITTYTNALSELGNMSLVYDTGVAKIQSSDIADNTGTALTTGGEIQKDITEIVKSTLNSIGGNVLFIPYDPSYIQNQMVTGYSNFADKVIPDVVVTGGITEFDRGLETRDTGVDAAGTATFSGTPSWVPSNEVGVNYGNNGKEGLARITLDFNMKDFKTLAGIPKMTTTNSIEVHKAVKQKELGITLFGPTFGLKGAIKKVQGRHEAVRLLVQLSMIEMVGKYLALPYWRVLGPDAKPDPVVVDSVTAKYYSLSPQFRIALAQQWLYVYGYQDVKLNGRIDAPTLAALQKIFPDFPADGQELSENQFVNLYLNMPYDAAALGRRNALNNIISQAQAQQQAATQQQAAPQQQAAAQQQAAPQQQAPAQETAPTAQEAAAPAQEAAPAQQANQAPAASEATQQAQPQAQATAQAPAEGGNTSSTGFGRRLKDSEW